jgi:transposase-like protein
MPKHISFRYFKTSPEIIQLAVVLYVRFPLSLRNVEDLLHERRVNYSYAPLDIDGTSFALNLHARSRSAGQGAFKLVIGNGTWMKSS